MTFAEFWYLLRRRWWVIVLVTAAAAIAALGYSLVQPLTYRAAAEVLVLPSRSAGDLKAYTAAQMSALRAVLLSFPKDDPTLPADLPGRLYVGLVPDEGRIVIEVDDPDPLQAARLANELAARLQAWVEEYNASQASADRVDLRILVPAEASGAPIRPRTRLNTAAGAVLGALLGLPLAFLWEALGRQNGPAGKAR